MEILIIVLVAILLCCILIYNSLISKRNQVRNISSSIDAQLQKRYDLIPNLVSSVKQYLLHEKSVLENIAAVRANAINAKSDKEKFELNNQISKLLGDIRVAVEAYPDLKASQNVMHLQVSLNEVEEQISAARRAYNSCVMNYNNACEMFPTNIFASLFSFQKAEFYNSDENAKKSPKVSELFK